MTNVLYYLVLFMCVLFGYLFKKIMNDYKTLQNTVQQEKGLLSKIWSVFKLLFKTSYHGIIYMLCYIRDEFKKIYKSPQQIWIFVILLSTMYLTIEFFSPMITALYNKKVNNKIIYDPIYLDKKRVHYCMILKK